MAFSISLFSHDYICCCNWNERRGYNALPIDAYDTVIFSREKNGKYHSVTFLFI